MAKRRKVMSDEHKQKLREAYQKRKRAEELGVHLPTQKELRAAAKAKKAPITAQSVNKLVEELPATVQETRANTPIITRFESSPNKRHPLRFRETHEQNRQAQR